MSDTSKETEKKPPLDQRRKPNESSFGSRFLTEKDDVYQYNSWDNVEWTEERQRDAEKLIENQSKMPEVKIQELKNKKQINWDKFYKCHEDKFFKPRNWLDIEFPELFQRIEQVKVLEIGCGTGSTIYPILEKKPDTVGYAMDFSENAVRLVQENENYSKYNISAFVHDLTSADLPAQIEPESLDFIFSVFVLSAIEPAHHDRIIKKLAKLLKPNGMVFFRDYARYDLSQLRFKKERLLDENLYARGDGTLCYYFTLEELKNLFEENGFEVLQNAADKRLLVNRKRRLEMIRIWIQGKYIKKTLE